MNKQPAKLIALPCLDSAETAQSRRDELDIPQARAAELGRSAVAASSAGYYLDRAGNRVALGALVQAACGAKKSIAPDHPLPTHQAARFSETKIQVANQTTLQAARRLVENGKRPVALNFANGFHAGGGFLNGARAQEEALCRCSALYPTLVGDPMYAHHAEHCDDSTSAWTIYSPDVPVFRTDDGTALDQPWLLSFLSCAAPVAYAVGQPQSAELLQQRIHRILAIARAYQHPELILGAWGCGVFGNDPHRTAADFRQALETEFSGTFSEIVFAITDWSPDRTFLGPFRDCFAP